MEHCCTTYSSTQVYNYDPTRTTGLRNAFAQAMFSRFKELAIVVKKSVVDNDCFGLKKINIHQMDVVPENSFNFVRSSEKVEAFIRWLEEQIKKGILQVTVIQQIGSSVDAAWTNMYLLDSYKRGLLRARAELIRLGVNIPSIEESGGILAVLNGPYHLDRIGLIYTRVFSDLKGITDAMDTIISRILAQGIADGDGPALLARKLVAAINGKNVGKLGIIDKTGRFIPAGRRAMILARTEIIRAHHLATIQEYRNWGVEGVTVKGEWKTADDDRVCPECKSMEGKVFTLDEIEPMIPLHPQCRCIALPYIEDIQKYLKK